MTKIPNLKECLITYKQYFIIMPELTLDQKQSIKQYIEDFKVFMKTEKGLTWEKERKSKLDLIKTFLIKDHVLNLTENEFGQIIKALWANEMWTNKDYLVGKLLKDNSLQKLREEFNELIYGTDTLEARYDNFRKRIKGLGPSSLTEILLFSSPTDYCIWNSKPKNVLPFLTIKLLPSRVFKYQITGRDYVKCIAVLSFFKEILDESGFTNTNFVDVDFFLAYIFYEILEKQIAPDQEEKTPELEVPIRIPEINVKKLQHFDIQGILLELGNLLGYATYVADPAKEYKNTTLGNLATLKEIPEFTYRRLLDTVKNIDVIWFDEEFPKYCFEIEHTTGVTMGLLMLYQIRKITDAKFFIIAPQDIISKFRTEISKDPFHQIKQRYTFRSYSQLVEMFEQSNKYHQLKDSFFIDN